MNSYVIGLFIFLSAVLSGGLFHLLKWPPNRLKLILSLSGAYLFAITVLHLIPEIYHVHDHYIGVYLLGGFFLQLVLDYFSEGIEHGHIHVHKNHDHAKARIPVTMMLSLCIHAFFEGMPIGGTHNHHTSNMLVFGIIIHNVPIALALMSLLTQSGVTKSKSLMLLAIFAAMTPFGMVLSSVLNHSTSIDIAAYYQKIMAVVIGIFLHISTTILFESSENHRFNLQKLGVIITGIALALSTLFLI